MAPTPYLVDTNVLVRWLKPEDRDYPLVVSAIDIILQRSAVLCFTSQNVAEFWNTCTRPLARNGYGLSPQETDSRVRYFEERMQLLPDSLTVHQEWRKLLVSHSVSGVQVHDARLVAAMRVYHVKQILTFNDRDFARYGDVEAVHPRTIKS
jgi:predicted nucleic acid-binding protein